MVEQRHAPTQARRAAFVLAAALAATTLTGGAAGTGLTRHAPLADRAAGAGDATAHADELGRRRLMRRLWAAVMSVLALFALVTAISRAPSGRNN